MIIAAAAALLAGIMAAGTIAAGAVDLNRPAGIDTLNRPGVSASDLQIYRQQQRREAFQELQQRNRQDERDAVRTPERLDVPRMRNGCQIQVNGSRFLTVCR